MANKLQGPKEYGFWVEPREYINVLGKKTILLDIKQYGVLWSFYEITEFYKSKEVTYYNTLKGFKKWFNKGKIKNII